MLPVARGPVSLTPLLSGLLLLSGCGQPARSRAPASGTPASRSARSEQGRIEGSIERGSEETPQTRRMRIWGQVKLIMDNEHGELPPLTRMSEGGFGDPVTELSNQTGFHLTIWFSGKCAHQVKVLPQSKVTAVFCPGTYHIAAVANDKQFLPLVRENQHFEPGIFYKLDFFVKKAPKK